jgi:hypothetical protein
LMNEADDGVRHDRRILMAQPGRLAVPPHRSSRAVSERARA